MWQIKKKISHNLLTLHQFFSKKKQPFYLLHWFFFSSLGCENPSNSKTTHVDCLLRKWPIINDLGIRKVLTSVGQFTPFCENHWFWFLGQVQRNASIL
jgi:hypothetical protein